MGVTEDGIQGELRLFRFLKEHGFDIFQADCIGLKNGTYYLFETKHQERFTPPPFEGHGLPYYQVKARLAFEKATGIKAILVIFDKTTNEIFYQSFKTLERGEYIDTQGANKRRVYKLSNFKKI